VEIIELRLGTSSRGSAIRAAVSRLMECGETLDAEIRSRSLVLEDAIADGTRGWSSQLRPALPISA
jgi:hypothetical protein